ncbi:MAG TPA: translocation/assembly module TamB domain-containing protein, partial [Thermoanaerobaculia bacterium]|nr:translocation/assembly module TamB domain-containing protein [Thermoanaerobaculia bacterium]
DSLFVAGRIGLGGGSPLDLHVEAGLAALWLAPMVGDLDLGGRLEGLARVQGTLERPEVNGQVAWLDGRFVPPVVPHTLENLRALVLLYPDLVVLDRLDGGFAGGAIAAKGRVELPTDERGLDYRFELTARRVAPRWPAGWQLRGDADLVFASSEGGRSLRGEVDLERAWYLRDLKLSPAQLIQRLLARSRVEVATTDERLTTTALQIAVRGEDAVRVRNNVARLGGDLDLVVLGTLARPVVFGEITIDEGGTATYGGNTYTVERGRVTFSNPLRIVPVLDVAARSRVDQYDVTLNLSGPLERLNTTFSSDPPLPDLDIVSLIATGSTSRSSTFSEVAAAPGTTEALSAEALLYGQAASLLTERVGRLFGLDQVRVQPLTSGDTISEARVTVGKRLSSKLYVTYSVDPSSTAQQILQVEWRIDRHLVLVLTQNGNDSYAVDARWERRFGGRSGARRRSWRWRGPGSGRRRRRPAKRSCGASRCTARRQCRSTRCAC